MNKVKLFSSNKKIILFLFFLIVSWIFLLNSPLSIIGNGDTWIDSSVFKTVALHMQNEFMPYKDIFDHKGPLLYIINYVGNLINYYDGILYVELLFLTVTFLFMYRTARIYINILNSIVVVLLSSTLLFYFFQGGNFAEEYAMTFISISLFIFIDYFQNNVINKKRLIMCGFSFGSVLMLRPNMISIWIAFCIAVLLKCIKEKEYYKLIEFLLWFLLGVSIIIVPILIWLAINNSLVDFWDCYINFNFSYSKSYSSLSIIKKIRHSFLFYSNPPMVSLSTAIIFYFVFFRRKFIDIVYGVYFLIEIAMISLSGVTHGHYGMVLVPLISYPLAKGIESIKINSKLKIEYFTVIFVIIFSLLPHWIPLVKNMNVTYKYNKSTETSDQKVSNLIRNLMNENDTLSVYGNWTSVHIKTKLLSPSKYISVSNWGCGTKNFRKLF